MTCATCGRDERTEANFCSNCGRVLAWQMNRGTALPYPSRFVRLREGRFIAGVCASIAQHYGWDISLVRILAVLLISFSGGAAVLVYLAAWVIIPNAPLLLPAGQQYAAQATGTMGQ